MFQESISRGVENVTDPRVRRKTNLGQMGGLKQRMKPLSDVKNTLESHSTNLIDKKGNTHGKKLSKGSLVSAVKRSNKVIKVNNSSNKPANIDTMEHISESAEDDLDIHDTHNHFACEEVNNLSPYAYLDEYRLTQKEKDRLSDRMLLFTMNRFPLRLKPVITPNEDIEIVDEINKVSPFDENEDVDDITLLEVPRPSFL